MIKRFRRRNRWTSNWDTERKLGGARGGRGNQPHPAPTYPIPPCLSNPTPTPGKNSPVGNRPGYNEWYERDVARHEVGGRQHRYDGDGGGSGVGGFWLTDGSSASLWESCNLHTGVSRDSFISQNCSVLTLNVHIEMRNHTEYVPYNTTPQEKTQSNLKHRKKNNIKTPMTVWVPPH